MLQQAMNAGNANIVKFINAVAHHASGERRFFGDGNIAGAGGDDENRPFARDFGAALDSDDAGERMEVRSACGSSVGFLHSGEDFGVGAGDENVLARIFFPEHGTNDFGNLLRRLAFSKNNFGKALAQRAMMIDFREAKVFERKMLEPFDGRAGGKFPSAHGFQNFQQVCLIHAILPLEILSLARTIAAA